MSIAQLKSTPLLAWRRSAGLRSANNRLLITESTSNALVPDERVDEYDDGEHKKAGAYSK